MEKENKGSKKEPKIKKKDRTISEYLPIEKIENGVIYTKDKRYVKILEISPINFLLRSSREQRNIIYSFVSYLKISPVSIQIKCITKRADIDKHLDSIYPEIETEENEQCKKLQYDYIDLLNKLGSKEAITRRFFLIFDYKLLNRNTTEAEALAELKIATNTARTYLAQCGNEVIEPDNEDEHITEIFYQLLNRKTSVKKPLSEKINEVICSHVIDEKAGISFSINEFIAPKEIDISHSRYIKMDNLYYSYLFIPTNGYKSKVTAGWLSLIINAGEGIDLDLYLQKQPREQSIRRLGQQLRINRSKIKEASDTNTDFDDLSGAIQAGYFLKDGLSNNEDFYYFNILITISGQSVQELEWRIKEMQRLMLSQDLEAKPCLFRQEQAFLSSLPLCSLDKNIYGLSKRNALTSGIAAAYPFLSYEICDDKGILLGVNKHNNSLIITDIFNSKIYKNANIALLGTSGAGKTYTMQLMALRMRRKNIQVFILAPLKGHEFRRACQNIGGEFIQISPASRNCINIMEIRKVDTVTSDLLDGPIMNKSALASKIQNLHIFFSLLIPDMNNEERQLLDEALIKTYNQYGITHDNQSLFDPENNTNYRKMPILGDVYNILTASKETKRMANILNRLVNGSASSFNQQTNVDLSNKYIVLDISELTGDLLTVGMFVALDYVWDKAKENRTKEKAIFVDETWQLIGGSSNKLAAEYVLEIFKIIRGYGGSAICATQDLNDFFALENGKYGKGIINNAKTKIVLNLEDDEADRVREVLHLSEAEVMAITHFSRGNGLISTNNNHVTVEFKSSDLEKELITTDREELQQLLKKKQNVI